jgi:hypothetical protein
MPVGTNAQQLAGTVLAGPTATGVAPSAGALVPNVNAVITSGTVTGSFSASGFSPTVPASTLATPLTPAASSVASIAAPTGVAVLIRNVGTALGYIRTSVGSGTANANDIPFNPGDACVLTLGTATFINAFSPATAGSSFNAVGGSGQGSCPTGGGVGGSSANASVGATAATAPGSATYNGMLVSGGNMVGASGSIWGTAPTGLNVLGVNADILSSALPTGAATQATLASLLTAVGSPLQAGGSVAVTSSALPSGAATAVNQEVTAAGTTATSAQAVQGVTGGVPISVTSGVSQATNSVPINISTATTTQLVALSAGKVIQVTAWDVIAAGTGNITLEYGTGSNCATGTTALTGVYNLAAQAGIAKGDGLGPVLFVPSGNALCALTSAAVGMAGSLSFLQF